MAALLSLRSSARTDRGKRRQTNEDVFTADPVRGLFVIADGMGGHGGGDVAARLANDTIMRAADHIPDAPFLADPSLPNRQRIFDWLAAAADEANGAIMQAAVSDARYRGMGCTLDVMLLRGSGAFFAHVGDGRAYVLRGSELVQLTEDHTMAQVLFAAGQLTREEAASHPKRNVLMRSLGTLPRVQVDMFFLDLAPRDRLLLCSDGLHGELSIDRLRSLLAGDPMRAAHELVGAVLGGEARDNVTAVAVAVGHRTAQPSTTIGATETCGALRKSTLFAALGDGELVRAQRTATERLLQPDELVFSEGSAGDAFYVVINGRLRVEKEQVVVSELKPGDHFGEMALIDDLPRSASVRAVTAARLIAFPRGEFDELLRGDLAIGNKLLRGLLSTTSQRLREVNQEVSIYRRALHRGVKGRRDTR